MKKLKEGLLTFLIPSLYFLGIILIYKNWINRRFEENILILSISLFFVLIGLFLWGFGFLELGKESFSVLPKAKSLKTTGPYRYFRHPIYLGIILVYFGLSLATNSKLGLFYSFLIILPINIIRAKIEEKILKQEFGIKYEDYLKRTLF